MALSAASINVAEAVKINVNLWAAEKLNVLV